MIIISPLKHSRISFTTRCTKIFHRQYSALTFNQSFRNSSPFPVKPQGSKGSFYTISFRSMHKVIGRVPINPTRFLRETTSRHMSCFHAGKLTSKIKPAVKNTDVTGQHQVVVQTTCEKDSCTSINCADPKINTNCNQTVAQNQTQIPATHLGYETQIIGNLTSTRPSGKIGFTVHPTINYAGQAKPQELVLESTPVTMDFTQLRVDSQSTSFVQANHDTIKSNLP